MSVPPVTAAARAATSTAPAAATPATPAGADAAISSTTPDLPKGPTFLSIPHALAWGAGLGLAAGALLLRSKGAGFGLAALGSGAWKGAAVGAGLGAALVGVDRVTGGEVKRQTDVIFLDRRAQIGFVVRHPTKPWLGPMGLGVASDARAAQEHYFGKREPLDGAQDAYRHVYAAALFSLRAMRDHGASPDEAHGLAIEAGQAHETDGQDNNDRWSREMDVANNLTGTQLIADGHAATGEEADAAGFVTEAALRVRVLDALRDGKLQVVDRSATVPTPRATTPEDAPKAA